MVGVCVGVACNIAVANLTLPLVYVHWDPVVQLCACVHMCNSLILLEESFSFLFLFFNDSLGGKFYYYSVHAHVHKMG